MIPVRLCLAFFSCIAWLPCAYGGRNTQGQDVHAPLNTIAHFSCTVRTGTVQWMISWPTTLIGGEYYWPRNRQGLSQKGIEAILHNETSVMSVNATQSNDRIRVQCLQQQYGISTSVPEASYTLIVYGRPAPPRLPYVMDFNDSFLIIGWNSSDSFGIKSYNVCISNSTWELRSGSLTEVYYAYRYLKEESCLPYYVTVMSKNDAGFSENGPPLTVTIPSPLSSVRSEAVFNASDQGSINIVINIEQCSSYPVERYSVKFQCFLNAENVNSTTSEQYTIEKNDSRKSNVDVVIKSRNLQLNSVCRYTVGASNALGNITTSQKSVYTTDVQSSFVTGVGSNITVACHFAIGTQAKGCALVLVNSVERIQANITRVNGTSIGALVLKSPVKCYTVSVYDWELDGSTGLLEVPVNLTVQQELSNSTDMCEMGGLGKDPNPSISITVTIDSFSRTLGTMLRTETVPTQTINHSRPAAIAIGLVCSAVLLAVLTVTAILSYCAKARRKVVMGSITFGHNVEANQKPDILSFDDKSITTREATISKEPCTMCSSFSHYYDTVQSGDRETDSSEKNHYDIIATMAEHHGYSVLKRQQIVACAAPTVQDGGYACAFPGKFPTYAVLEEQQVNSNQAYEYTEPGGIALDMYKREEIVLNEEALYEVPPTAGTNV